MKRSTFDALLSFLGGVSWAFVIVGAWVTFQSFVFLGIVPALMFTFLFIFLAVFLLLVLETMAMARERNDILEKQNALLEEIRESVKAPFENTPQA
jgi:large-conductance mechanosensitive channel